MQAINPLQHLLTTVRARGIGTLNKELYKVHMKITVK